MPEMDGIEAVKILRGMGYNEPVVALTANTILGQAELFLANGFAGFISKPIDITRLNYYLVKLLRDKQPPEVLAAAKEATLHIVDISSELRESFVRDTQRALEILEALLEKPEWSGIDYKSYTINTHGIKSALANIGEAQLAGTAGSLEQAGRDKSVDYIRSETKLFLGNLRGILKTLLPKEEKPAEVVSGSSDDLIKRLLVIKDACEGYSKKEAKKLIKEMNSQSWTEETKVFLKELSVKLLHSEFEDMCVDIEKFLENIKGVK
jgi:CheY-like chemotaxis protein